MLVTILYSFSMDYRKLLSHKNQIILVHHVEVEVPASLCIDVWMGRRAEWRSVAPSLTFPVSKRNPRRCSFACYGNSSVSGLSAG